MKAIVYVDGFNLYDNCFKGKRNLGRRHLRWLDLRRLVEQLLATDEIIEVNYYTAMVSSRAGDFRRPLRQQAYLQSFTTHAGVRVHLGQFRKTKRSGRLAQIERGVPVEQTVEIMQEKGSDVCLTTHMLLDGFQARYDLPVLLSDDSDYAEPIRVIANVLNTSVRVISPDIHVCKQLAKLATFARPLDLNLLETSQLPDDISRSDRLILTRPIHWTKLEADPSDMQ